MVIFINGYLSFMIMAGSLVTVAFSVMAMVTVAVKVLVKLESSVAVYR